MRYLPLTQPDREAMLGVIGVTDIDALFADVPETARLTTPIAGLPNHSSEMQVERDLAAMANRNLTADAVPFFVGGGAYKHHVPATVDHIIQRGEFLTAYTPTSPKSLKARFRFCSNSRPRSRVCSAWKSPTPACMTDRPR